MTIPLYARNRQFSGTDIVAVPQTKEELENLRIEDQLLTKAMGGVLAEQANLSSFQRVLDIACGSGSWVIEAALQYPHMSLVGIDINPHVIEYARLQAAQYHVEDRVEFYTMDALRFLEFPDEAFDLVNMRFVMSFLRTWDWPRLLNQVQRVLRPGGIVRLTDEEITHQSNSPTAMRFFEMLQGALFRSGHLFTQTSDGLTAHLAPLLAQHGYEHIKTTTLALQFSASTPEMQAYLKASERATRYLRPFLQKWSALNRDFELMQRQMREEAQHPDFYVILHLLTVWATRPLQLEF